MSNTVHLSWCFCHFGCICGGMNRKKVHTNNYDKVWARRNATGAFLSSCERYYYRFYLESARSTLLTIASLLDAISPSLKTSALPWPLLPYLLSLIALLLSLAPPLLSSSPLFWPFSRCTRHRSSHSRYWFDQVSCFLSGRCWCCLIGSCW